MSITALSGAELSSVSRWARRSVAASLGLILMLAGVTGLVQAAPLVGAPVSALSGAGLGGAALGSTAPEPLALGAAGASALEPAGGQLYELQSQAGVGALIAAQSQDLIDCHSAHGDGELYTLELQLRAFKGRVLFPAVQEPSALRPELQSCIEKAARGWRVSPTVNGQLSWPVVLTAAPALLNGALPSPADPAAVAYARSRRQALEQTAQLLPAGVLLLAGQVYDGGLQDAHALRDSSPEGALTAALLPALELLGQSAAPPDMPGFAFSVSSGPLPRGREPSLGAVRACVRQTPVELSVVVVAGRVVSAWGDACLSHQALSWQLDPVLEGGMRWTLLPALPELLTSTPAPALLPESQRQTLADPQDQLQQNLRYYRTLSERCFEPGQSAQVEVEIKHGLTQSVTLVQSSGDAQSDACVVAQAEGWTWPVTVQQTRRVSLP